MRPSCFPLLMSTVLIRPFRLPLRSQAGLDWSQPWRRRIGSSQADFKPLKALRPARHKDRGASQHNRKLWIGVLFLCGVLGITETGQQYSEAVQRTYRVLNTLLLCINDYRQTLKCSDIAPEGSDLLKACHKRCAARTLVAMEKNGSIFIKLGQHLSSLTYILPREWCDTFIPLQDKCPVSSLKSIKSMVLKDTGRELDDYFIEFEPLPIGAASLAQVHRAVLRDTGERVAVKVQHPSLDDWAPLDLALTRISFRALRYWFPEYDLTWLSEEMDSSLPLELDFENEGKNANRAREYFARIPDMPVIIPRVVWAHRRILVMEFISGARPDDLDYLDSHGIDRDEVSATLSRIFNEMIFGTNAPLHCDPHGGNLAIRFQAKTSGSTSNFGIVIYDHGLYRDLSTQLRRNYAKLWLAVLDQDIPAMRIHAERLAGINDKQFELFASTITGRDFSVLSAAGGGVQNPRDEQEKKAISEAMCEGMLAEMMQLLGQMPRVILLILKTNDLSKSMQLDWTKMQG